MIEIIISFFAGMIGGVAIGYNTAIKKVLKLLDKIK